MPQTLLSLPLCTALGYNVRSTQKGEPIRLKSFYWPPIALRRTAKLPNPVYVCSSMRPETFLPVLLSHAFPVWNSSSLHSSWKGKFPPAWTALFLCILRIVHLFSCYIPRSYFTSHVVLTQWQTHSLDPTLETSFTNSPCLEPCTWPSSDSLWLQNPVRHPIC